MGIQPRIVGWREFIDQPDVGLIQLQVRIDTVARTSALHVGTVERFRKSDGAEWVRFSIGIGSSADADPELPLTALLVDTRAVRSSYGETELRLVICTSLAIGTHIRDKLHSMQLLARDGIGLPVTAFAHDPKQTEQVLEIAGGAPVLIKLLEGTQGIGVVRADTARSAKSVIEAFGGQGSIFWYRSSSRSRVARTSAHS